MSRHVVVIGLGSVGMAVARELRDTGYDVAIIDRLDGNRFAQQARDEGMPVLVGDATMHETLEAAGIERARGVAVLTSDDMVNIEVGLAVRDALGERRIPVALRVFERDLGRVLGRELDIGVTRSTAELAAPWFVGGALGLHIISTFYVGTTPILAAWITVREGGALEGRAIGTLASATRVVAIRRSGEGGWLEHPLDRDAVLRQGDVAYFVGQYEELLGMLERS